MARQKFPADACRQVIKREFDNFEEGSSGL